MEKKFSKIFRATPPRTRLSSEGANRAALKDLENSITEDIDTLLTGPPEKRQATEEGAPRPSVEAGESERGNDLPGCFYQRAKEKVPSGSHPTKNSRWQAVSR